MKRPSILYLLLIVASFRNMQCAYHNSQQADIDDDGIEFVIVIPSYKNEKWARENLHSACTQKSSRPFQVICINDASPDRTGEVMEEYVREYHLESQVTVIHNKINAGALANIYNTVHQHIADHKVVVLLDGDDLLADDQVLLTLEKYYRDPDVWMTYGSVKRSDTGESLMLAHQIPHDVLRQKKLREFPFTATHLRTFKAGLFKNIDKDDLMYKGAFASAAWDLAIMFPMLEMCCFDCDCNEQEFKVRSRYISDMLYVYRVDNPLSDHVVRLELQKNIDEFIRSKPPYLPLKSFEHKE